MNVVDSIHITKNPIATSTITIQCSTCGQTFDASAINCIDTLIWPEGRQVLDEGTFFHYTCPHCQTMSDVSYSCRYIDTEQGISAVLIPGIDMQDSTTIIDQLNAKISGLLLDKMEHRITSNFYALAEQMRIHKYHLNDRAIQLLKPFIIGQMQSRGLEVWNGFFTGIEHPDSKEPQHHTVYISTSQDANVYTEDIFQFNIHLTNGEILPHGINKTAYHICTQILDGKGLKEDDGKFHFYDLSWAIDFHNHLE